MSSAEQVREIRQSSLTNKALGTRFGISRDTVRKIKARRHGDICHDRRGVEEFGRPHGAHNAKIAGSNPASATKKINRENKTMSDSWHRKGIRAIDDSQKDEILQRLGIVEKISLTTIHADARECHA